MAEYILGVDTGGTFTDTVVVRADGPVEIGKARSTPDEFSRGVLDSVRNTLHDPNGDGLQGFLHGTTISTNALITRSGSTVGVVTTKGHRDALFFMRVTGRVAGLSETELYDYPRTGKPEPLVPKFLIAEIEERVDFSGDVVVPLNEEQAREAIEKVLAEGVQALAVCLLWSFRNPSHEKRVRELIAELAPGIPVSLSSEIAPKIGEYERSATVAVNAYTQPLIEGYIDKLQGRLAEANLLKHLLIMQSAGGCLTADEMKRLPVTTINSGPAGGIIACQNLGRLIGHENIIGTDVGGTSFDVGLVVDGEPVMTPTRIVNQYTLMLPSVDVVSIGAGGGSIARAEGGRLRVGPESAGADPGPACFGFGGEFPTVTDADVVLGVIDPDFFLGGQMRLDRELAERAIRTKVAEPLGLSLEEASSGIADIASAHMADLVRKTTIERGYDPRDFFVYAYGGAGPTHATSYGRDLGCQGILIPLRGLAPVFSAFGIATADLLTVKELSDAEFEPFDLDKVFHNFERLSDQARSALLEQGARPETIELAHYLEMRYSLQVYQVEVPVDLEQLETSGADSLIGEFERRYQSLYGEGSGFREAGIEIVSYRVIAKGRMLEKWGQLAASRNGRTSQNALKGHRQVYWIELGDWEETPVYQGEALAPRATLTGPAIIEEQATTIPLRPNQRLEVDQYGNLIISI